MWNCPKQIMWNCPKQNSNFRNCPKQYCDHILHECTMCFTYQGVCDVELLSTVAVIGMTSPCQICTYKSHKFELLEKSSCTYCDWGQNLTFTKLGNKQQTEAPSHSHPDTPTPPSAGPTSMHIVSSSFNVFFPHVLSKLPISLLCLSLLPPSWST